MRDIVERGSTTYNSVFAVRTFGAHQNALGTSQTREPLGDISLSSWIGDEYE